MSIDKFFTTLTLTATTVFIYGISDINLVELYRLFYSFLVCTILICNYAADLV